VKKKKIKLLPHVVVVINSSSSFSSNSIPQGNATVGSRGVGSIWKLYKLEYGTTEKYRVRTECGNQFHLIE
jgi:hypothetical protein